MNERIQARIAALTQERATTAAQCQHAQMETQRLALLVAQYDAAIGELEGLLTPEADANDEPQP